MTGNPHQPGLSPAKQALVALERLQGRVDALDALDRRLTEPIAIIGVGCRFPGGVDDPAAYWRLLCAGINTRREVPRERWDVDAYYDPDPDAPGKISTRYGSFLDGIDGFDAAFFGISPREAMRIDPQHRLLLEVAWEALEHARVAPNSLAGTRTGVFAGVMSSEYSKRLLGRDYASVDAYYVTGNELSFAPGRISYFLGLRGPCITVDTACSSSMVAVHQACQSLRAGESDLALAGGVSLVVTPELSVALSKTHVMAADGLCKTFDATANGLGRGEGAGMIVLRRLSDALRLGDRILCVIRGSAVNHGGMSGGITVPSGTGQEALLRAAIANARIPPLHVGYVEAHGTGTEIGDLIEARAIAAVLGEGRTPDRPLRLGSVKTNLGHLDSAAGIAGLIKTALMLAHREFPPHINLKTLNPEVPWAACAMEVLTTRTPWTGDHSRIAGVSAFGLSGINGHVILEEAPTAIPQAAAPARTAELCVLSAGSPEALNAAARRLHEHLSADPPPSIGDLAFSLATTRAHLEHRLAVTAPSLEALQTALAAAAQGDTPAGVARRKTSADAPKVAFVFPGQGSQWPGMGKQLISEAPVFRAALEKCEAVLQAEAGWSLLEQLMADEASSQLERIDVAQPALFAMQVALAALWRSWGVEPDAVVGHSMGEVAAAHVAGALSLADAAAIIVRRSRLMRRISGRGEMAFVELSLAEAEAALAGHADRLSVAASNGPSATVIAGEPPALAEVLSALEAKGVFVRRVKVDVASHSAQVDPILDDLRAALSGLHPHDAALPMRSTVTGTWVPGSELRASYWANNLRQPVRFAGAVQALIEDGYSMFVEMTPHPLLVQSIHDNAQAIGRQVASVGSLRRGQAGRQPLLESLGALYVHGYPVAWDSMFPDGGARVPLPTYAWQRQRYWIQAPSVKHATDSVVTEDYPQIDREPTQSTASPEGPPLAPGFRDLPASERRLALDAYLRAQVAKVLGLAASQIDPSRTMQALGMDSLTALELRKSIAALGVSLGLRTILAGASVATLVDLVVGQLDEAAPVAPAPEPPPSEPQAQSNPWIFVRRPQPQASVRLLCFPYSGGGPAVFARWPEQLPSFIELSVIHLPGRGSRLDAPSFVHMEPLVDALAPSLRSYVGEVPTAFLGHSLGALIMFEVAHRLRDVHGVGPTHMFVSGSRAPHLYHPEQLRTDALQFSTLPGVPSHALPESNLLETLRDLGFDASKALDDDHELRELMLPTVRADLQVNNTYLYTQKPPLDIPITALGGRVDPFVNAEQLQGWRRHTTSDFSMIFRPGGHYFIEQELPFLVEMLTRELSPITKNIPAAAAM